MSSSCIFFLFACARDTRGFKQKMLVKKDAVFFFLLRVRAQEQMRERREGGGIANK
jgi:hypothetical protein